MTPINDIALFQGEILSSHSFFVRGSLPTLNEYTEVTRSNLYASAKMKKDAEERIIWEIRSQLKGWKTQGKVYVLFKWIEKNKRRDKDNVSFAKKFVLDALVKSGTICNDSWRYIEGFADQFDVDPKHHGVQVDILEVG